MPYLWTDTQSIQNYLGNMTIRIGDADDDTFSVDAAEQHENDAVSEISDLIGIAWSGLETVTPSTVPAVLKRMVARLAAAKIGVSTVSSSFGELPAWCTVYRNEVFAQIMRMLLARNTVSLSPLQLRSGITDRDILTRRLLR
ncbi:MAG: hypothetical protein OXL96_21120 [Candidatus Poribacteria bacterium]|nr:hypothetical protein [Candidatus Poribacteria bacterium]